MEAIDIDASVTAEATHDRVTFRLSSERSDTVAVRLEQPIVSGVATSQVAIDADYETAPWSRTEDSLVFTRGLDRGETVETGYAIGGVDASTLREMLRELTFEVRDSNGVKLGFLDGSELRVDGRRLGPGNGPEESDLPASISDYVLQDVGEIDPSEFEWTPVDESDTSGGLLSRLVPFL